MKKDITFNLQSIPVHVIRDYSKYNYVLLVSSLFLKQCHFQNIKNRPIFKEPFKYGFETHNILFTEVDESAKAFIDVYDK